MGYMRLADKRPSAILSLTEPIQPSPTKRPHHTYKHKKASILHRGFYVVDPEGHDPTTFGL